MVALDQAGAYGYRLEDREFWTLDGRKTITGRERM